jgi:TPP-dependent pyruvate/acetoin dehydrogenase alpha subunit
MRTENNNQPLISRYRMMRLIRTTETRLIKLFADSEVPGFIHLSIGQEAVAAGVMSALDERDSIATTHRGHGHVIARGLDLELFFKELMGKEDGICRGRGGSMHVADMAKGILGANGIVGAGIPIALGNAMAHSVRKTGGVAAAFFGDGAMATGVLHESMNLAALWQLPMLFVCENNGWSEFSPTKDQFVAELGELSKAFGIPHLLVDGNDVEAVATAAHRLTSEARTGGPRVLECKTRRLRGHFEGDPQKYRPVDETLGADGRDPIKQMEDLLQFRGVTAKAIQDIITETEEQVSAAVEKARRGAEPGFADALADVYTVTGAGGKDNG